MGGTIVNYPLKMDQILKSVKLMYIPTETFSSVFKLLNKINGTAEDPKDLKEYIKGKVYIEVTKKLASDIYYAVSEMERIVNNNKEIINEEL